MDVVQRVQSLGGFATTAQLNSSRSSERALTAAVRSGALRRPRRGCYSTLPPSDPRFRAVSLGGRLTGTSALHVMRCWMLRPPSLLHVALDPGAQLIRRPASDVRVHWVRSGGSSPAVVPVTDALTQTVLDEPTETAVVALDWARSTGRIDLIDFERIMLTLPQSARSVRELVDPASQSLLESIARLRLARRGWSVRSQVPVTGFGPVDLVVEDRVALELDGREHHEASFEKDRRKDLQITLEGRHSIRVTYSMVVNDWARIERTIAKVLGESSGNLGVVPREPRGRRRTRELRRIDSEFPASTWE